MTVGTQLAIAIGGSMYSAIIHTMTGETVQVSGTFSEVINKADATNGAWRIAMADNSVMRKMFGEWVWVR